MALFFIRVQGQLVAMDAREADEGGYYASFPELKGCHTEASTLAELVRNAEEAVELYLEPLPAKPKRKTGSTTPIESRSGGKGTGTRTPRPNKGGGAKKVRP